MGRQFTWFKEVGIRLFSIGYDLSLGVEEFGWSYGWCLEVVREVQNGGSQILEVQIMLDGGFCFCIIMFMVNIFV